MPENLPESSLVSLSLLIHRSGGELKKFAWEIAALALEGARADSPETRSPTALPPLQTHGLQFLVKPAGRTAMNSYISLFNSDLERKMMEAEHLDIQIRWKQSIWTYKCRKKISKFVC